MYNKTRSVLHSIVFSLQLVTTGNWKFSSNMLSFQRNLKIKVFEYAEEF